jgi:hypothetical protein
MGLGEPCGYITASGSSCEAPSEFIFIRTDWDSSVPPLGGIKSTKYYACEYHKGEHIRAARSMDWCEYYIFQSEAEVIVHEIMKS